MTLREDQEDERLRHVGEVAQKIGLMLAECEAYIGRTILVAELQQIDVSTVTDFQKKVIRHFWIQIAPPLGDIGGWAQ